MSEPTEVASKAKELLAELPDESRSHVLAELQAELSGCAQYL